MARQISSVYGKRSREALQRNHQGRLRVSKYQHKWISHYWSIWQLPPRSAEPDNIVDNLKWKYWWILPEKKGPQKRLHLQVLWMQGYTAYYQALPEEIIEERGTLRNPARPGLSPAVKHNKGARANEGIHVMRIGAAKKGNKTLHNIRSRGPQGPASHNLWSRKTVPGLSLDEGPRVAQHELACNRPSSCYMRTKKATTVH